MSTSLPPLSQHDDRGRRLPRRGGDPPRSPRGWPGRRSLAALMAGTALLGGGAAAGILAATGQLDGGGTTTTVIEQPATVPTSMTAAGTSEGIDAAAVYAAAAPGW